MAIEQGKEYNPETASHLREREFRFEAFGTSFRYVLQIPEYILARLDSAVMDKLHLYMTGYCERVVTDAMRGGYLLTEPGKLRMLEDVRKHLSNYIWERFSMTQEQAGHDCWQVAPSLQEVLK